MKKFDINKLTDNERYAYLIQQINESGLVWMLQATDGMFAMFEDTTENQYIPIWPDAQAAETYISDDWEGYTTTSMKRNEFLDWMQELHDDHILIGAYPKDNLQVIPMKPLEIKSHLEDAARKL